MPTITTKTKVSNKVVLAGVAAAIAISAAYVASNLLPASLTTDSNSSSSVNNELLNNPEAGLVVYYRLDENTSNFTERGGALALGVGSITYTNAGALDGAAVLNGNSYILVKDFWHNNNNYRDPFDFSDSFTIAGWFKFNNDIGITRLIAKEDASISTNYWSYRLLTLDNGLFGFNDGLLIQLTGTDEQGKTKMLAVQVDKALAGMANQWVHIAATYDKNLVPQNFGDTQLKLFLNGTRILDTTTATMAVGKVTIKNTDADLGIGASGDGKFKLNGQVDDVRFYNKALNASLINSLYIYTHEKIQNIVEPANNEVKSFTKDVGPISWSFRDNGNKNSYSKWYIDGQLPPGLKQEDVGASIGEKITGTPTKSGSYPLTLSVENWALDKINLLLTRTSSTTRHFTIEVVEP